MDMRHNKKWGTRVAVFVNSALIVGFGLWRGSVASADLIPLPAGGTVAFNPTVLPEVGEAAYPGGSEAPLYSVTTNFYDTSNPSLIIGTLTSQIFLDASNNYEYVYQVNNGSNAAGLPNPPFPDSFDSLTISKIASTVLTSVGYNNPGGDTDPTNANRDVNNNLNWNFSTYGLIAPGQSSDYLIVDTNTQNYRTGSASVIDDVTAEAMTQVPIYMPGVPEPASVGLLVLAGGMVLGRRRRV
jgi:hypothetical protein